MKTRAAVLEKIGAPLSIRILEVPSVQRGQVLVKIEAAGICHSQLSEINGERGEDKYLPHLLGHEASGVVEMVGPGVKKVKRGDQVVLTWIKGQGLSPGGVQFKGENGTVNAGSIAVFSEYALVNESRVVPVKAKIHAAVAALFGCAVPTGVGAVLNSLKIRAGSSLVVIGVGGIGASAILAAKIASCHDVIAVDVQPKKLKWAKRLGATRIIDASKIDAEQAVREWYPDGVDYALEAAGFGATAEQAFNMLNNQGVLALAGHPRYGTTIKLDPHKVIEGRRIIGTWGGDVRPDRDIPRYIKWYQEGLLPVDKLITHQFPLAKINAAVKLLASGQAGRIIIEM